MSDIRLTKVDEVWTRFDCDPGIAQEISEFFSFYVPGYKFMPKFRSGQWDGRIKLANPFKRLIYSGLIHKLQEFARVREYEIDVPNQLLTQNFSMKEAHDFFLEVVKNKKYEATEHQLKGFVHCIRNNRALLLSPTSSGKSLILYLITKFYEQSISARSLLIVPSVGLVKQMADDFIDYGADPDSIHKISAGALKVSNKGIWISTWQSIVKQPREFFDQFKVIMVDEAHLAKAQSLTSIMEKANSTPHRFGCTGTLDGSITHELVTTGLFGPVKQVTTTKKMIDQGFAAAFKIKCVVLKWEDDLRKTFSKATYQDEIKWISLNEKRNKFIKNLALSLDGNVLILFNLIEQGQALRELIENSTDRKIHYIDGTVDGDVRNDIRSNIDGDDSSITIASKGTTSTGISVKNFNYLIFAHPSKGRIKNLQSIGRVLRVSERKNKAELIDIADDLSWKNKKNHTLRHFAERLDQYDSEEHPYKIFTVDFS
jgi:superfamily II DNA or RNA helicase